MEKKLKIYFEEWLVWIGSEKRLSKNTLKGYGTDVKSFFLFLENYQNAKVLLIDLCELDKNSLRGWFYERLKKGTSQRSNARALSSLKSFLIFLKKKRFQLTLKSPI